jgi:hypothetical protein
VPSATLKLALPQANATCAFSLEAPRKQIQADTINLRDSLNLLRRQSGFHCLALWVSEESSARRFIHVKPGEKSLEA